MALVYAAWRAPQFIVPLFSLFCCAWGDGLENLERLHVNCRNVRECATCQTIDVSVVVSVLHVKSEAGTSNSNFQTSWICSELHFICFRLCTAMRDATPFNTHTVASLLQGGFVNCKCKPLVTRILTLRTR